MLAWLGKHQQRFDNNTKSVLKFITNKTNKQPSFMDRDDYCSISSTFTVSNTQQTAAASMGEGGAVLTDEKTCYFLVDFLVVLQEQQK
jgi:hypothetical protein